MSDAAPGLPPAVPATGPAAAPRPVGPLLAGFALDWAVAMVLLVVVSAGVATAWMVARALAGVAPTGELDPMGQLLAAMAGVLVPALALYFWRRRADAGECLRSRQAAARPRTWLLSLLVGAGCFGFATGFSALASALGLEPVPSNLSVVEAGWQRWPVFLVLFAVLLAPAYEELLFRRVLFGRFLAGGRPWLGLLLSSLAFALVHEPPGLTANGLAGMLQLWLVYGVLGAAFAWVYWRTGTLWAALAAHALNNALALGSFLAGAA